MGSPMGAKSSKLLAKFQDSLGIVETLRAKVS
jgi:hypothetical protein